MQFAVAHLNARHAEGSLFDRFVGDFVACPLDVFTVDSIKYPLEFRQVIRGKIATQVFWHMAENLPESAYCPKQGIRRPAESVRLDDHTLARGQQRLCGMEPQLWTALGIRLAVGGWGVYLAELGTRGFVGTATTSTQASQISR